MGLLSKTLLFTLLNFSLIHGQNLCPFSSCGANKFTIKYPFKLHNQIPKNNCTYQFDLTCTSSTGGVAIFTLPHEAGDFYVQNIDYAQNHIHLYDPGKCLIKRIMNLRLEGSHLRAIYKERYTFYVCPSESQGRLRVHPIGCMSNSTNITIATPLLLENYFEGYGCRRSGSWKIPVSNPNEFEDAAFHGDFLLSLKWDVDVCMDCKGSDDQDSGNSGRKSMAKRFAIALISLPVLTIIALISCSLFCLHLFRMISKKLETDAPTTAPPPQTTALPPPSVGLDESKIMACTDIFVLSESDERIPSDLNGNTCSICLEIYCKREKLRIISVCGHCFHAICIQQWLGKNSTCPVCRTSLSDVDL